jgi:hypothetical protein
MGGRNGSTQHYRKVSRALVEILVKQEYKCACGARIDRKSCFIGRGRARCAACVAKSNRQV